MAIKVADNFLYQGRKPLDNRISVGTLTDMTSMADSIIYDGMICYVKADKLFYVYDSTNTVDPVLNKWRLLKTGGTSLKEYIQNTAYEKNDLLYLGNSLAIVNTNFTSDNTSATVQDSFNLDITNGNLILVDSESNKFKLLKSDTKLDRAIYNITKVQITDIKIEDSNLTLVSANISDLERNYLITDADGTIGRIKSIDTTNNTVDVETLTISADGVGIEVYKSNKALDKIIDSITSLDSTDLNTAIAFTDIKEGQLVYDPNGSVGKIIAIDTTNNKLDVQTISSTSVEVKEHFTSKVLDSTVNNTTQLDLTDFTPVILITDIALGQLVYDSKGTVAKVTSIDSVTNKVVVQTITNTLGTTNWMPIAPNKKEPKVKLPGTGYTVGDVIETTTTGVFAEVVSVDTLGGITSVILSTATAQSVTGSGAQVDYEQIIYGGYDKNWAALKDSSVFNAQILADTDDYEIGYSYEIVGAGSGYAVGDIVATNITDECVEVISVGLTGDILTVEFTRTSTVSTSGTGADITATLNPNMLIIPDSIWNKGTSLFELTNDDGAQIQYYRTGDVLVKYAVGAKSSLYKFTYNENKGYIVQEKTTLASTGSTQISAKSGNAIQQVTGSTVLAEDGLYVKDIEDKVDRINLAQKTVNSELEYFCAYGSGASVQLPSASKLDYLPYLKEIKTNLDSSRYTSTAVTLLKGKTYRLTLGILKDTSSVGGMSYQILDSDDNKIGSRGYSGSSLYGDNIIDVIYTPTDNIEIRPNVTTVTTKFYFPDCSFFTVVEINRHIVVDPVSYVDDTHGIEDLPVGSLVSFTGTVAPAHYLLCNGSVYNIADYPDLAEIIKSVYGAYNAFGGDGTITFATPAMQSANESPSGNGLISNYQTDGTAFTNIGDYSSSSGTYTNVFNYNTTSTWFASGNSQAFPIANKPCIGYEFNSSKYVNKVKITNMLFNSCYRCNDFDIEGSNDNTNWNVLLTGYLPQDAEEHEFDLTTTGLYKYYRLVFKKAPTGGPNYNWGLGKLKFYGVPGSSYIIKAEKTYFMNLEGIEVTEDLLTNKLFNITTNGVTAVDQSFALPTPITDFDEIETVYSYEDTTVVAKDSVSGVVATATEITPTPDNKGFSFPGTATSGITYSTPSGLDYPLTVEIAFSTTSTNAQSIFVHDVKLNLVVGVIGTNYIQLATTSHESKDNLAYDISNWNLNDGKFHTITVVYASADSANLYFDGVLKTSTTHSNSWRMTEVSCIGNRFNSPYSGAFTGIIYAVRFYNGILSQSDIVASYNSDRDYVLNNTAQITRNNLASDYSFYNSAEITHPYITSSKLSVKDIEYNSVLSVDKSVQNVSNNKVASTELQYTFTDKDNVKLLNVSNHYNNYLPGSKFGIRRLTGIKKISK